MKRISFSGVILVLLLSAIIYAFFFTKKIVPGRDYELLKEQYSRLATSLDSLKAENSRLQMELENLQAKLAVQADTANKQLTRETSQGESVSQKFQRFLEKTESLIQKWGEAINELKEAPKDTIKK